ncbi:MAG: cysteine desulfurase family protein, partial [Bacillota bacterium]
HIISTSIEHPSLYNQFQRLENEGFSLTKIAPEADGIVSPDQVIAAIRPETILISIMHVNNITGAVQPIKEIAEQAKKINPEILIHSDAIQALGKIKSFPEKLNLDLASYSGHKVHGPKGIGFLYLRRSSYASPLLLGGGQEDGLRNGTENVPGIAGLGQAVSQLPDLKNQAAQLKTTGLKNYLLEKLQKDFPEIKINTPRESAPHIINISRPGLPGEVIVNALNQRDIYISSGSACSSSRGKADRVLLEMGLSQTRAEGSIRISLSEDNTKADLDEFLSALQEELDFLS